MSELDLAALLVLRQLYLTIVVALLRARHLTLSLGFGFLALPTGNRQLFLLLILFVCICGQTVLRQLCVSGLWPHVDALWLCDIRLIGGLSRGCKLHGLVLAVQPETLLNCDLASRSHILQQGSLSLHFSLILFSICMGVTEAVRHLDLASLIHLYRVVIVRFVDYRVGGPARLTFRFERALVNFLVLLLHLQDRVTLVVFRRVLRVLLLVHLVNHGLVPLKRHLHVLRLHRRVGQLSDVQGRGRLQT